MKTRIATLMILSAAAFAQVRTPAADVWNVYDPEHAGTWALRTDFSGAPTIGATATHTAALSETMSALAEVIHRTPVLAAPKGVEVRALARYNTWDAWWIPSHSCGHDPASCKKVPLMAQIEVTLFNFFHLSDNPRPKPVTHIEDNADIIFNINVLGQALPKGGTRVSQMQDGRELSLKPIERNRVAGFPLYKFYEADNEAYMFFTNGRPLWVAATREQVISALMWIRGKTLEDQRKTIQQLEKQQQSLEKGSSAEQAIVRGIEASRDALARSEKMLLGRLREELNRMSPSERSSPAWLLDRHDGGSGLVPAGSPGAREVITFNLDYFDASRPRSDIQLITVTFNSQNERRTGPNFMTAAVRLDEFLATADWARIASFVQPAR